MALAANALTLVKTVTAEAGHKCDAGDEATIERLINVYSDRIEEYTNRKLAFVSGEVEDVAGYGLSNLSLSRYPVTALTTLTFDGQTIDVADVKIDADAGLLFRKSGFNWTAQRFLGSELHPLPDTEDPLYQATYDGGFVTPEQNRITPANARTLPFDLEDACVQAVLARFNKKGADVSVKSESYKGYSVSYETPGDDGLPASVRGMLNAYKRIRQA